MFSQHVPRMIFVRYSEAWVVKLHYYIINICECDCSLFASHWPTSCIWLLLSMLSTARQLAQSHCAPTTSVTPVAFDSFMPRWCQSTYSYMLQTGLDFRDGFSDRLLWVKLQHWGVWIYYWHLSNWQHSAQTWWQGQRAGLSWQWCQYTHARSP